MNRMHQRIAYGATAIALLLALFGIDAAIGRWAGGSDPALTEMFGPTPPPGPFTNLMYRGSVLPFFFALVLLKGTGELLTMLRAAGIFPYAKLTYVAVIAIFLSPWLSAGGLLGSDVQSIEGLLWPVALLALTAMACAGAQLLRGTPAGSIKDSSGTMLAVIYLGFLPSFAMQLRSGADTPGQQGVWLLLASVLIAKGSDIGAYFVGSTVGRHKLMPSVSPGKSVEGTIGGLFASVLAALLLAWAIPTAVSAAGLRLPTEVTSELTALFGRMTNTSEVIARCMILGLCLSAAGQIGDLFESCLKRDAGTKDSGMIMPQFGGILDLVDSPIFAVPVAWFLLTRVWHVG